MIAIYRERFVVRHQAQAIGARGRDEQPVEGVAMEPRQPLDLGQMVRGDREDRERRLRERVAYLRQR